ncbi:molybdenum cofactor cytidylyltransferase [Clostridium sp. ZS2-4]|uniref:molybdenum cofactor cytidylyltransferase n=1 Tax=Clostridium sp. ZS2-4 TaxID=2987703 RepID=UPI00227CDC9D|nr:molybdenum cofactor cytidylyltransferase [Clostridium sp. ZS2-4]MCY6353787.1 molybdenum cofactor cytidylyltransferase [Clostridium sp. ZS2-4]
MITAIIMASGYSRRMKENKLLLKYKGKPLIQQTIDMVLKCDFSQIILVAREKEILQFGKNSGLTVIENKKADRGISESIKLGVISADECDGYMFFTADQPLLNVDIINKLLQSFYQDKSHIIVPHYAGRRGSPVIFPEKFKQDLMHLEGDIGGKIIINKYFEQVRFVEIDDEKNLFDVDTQEDYKKILEWDEAEDDF